MRYEVWSVFTDTPEGGNPLAVVWGSPSDARMQRIAAEFGFSETTFVSNEDADGCDLRIFTPRSELSFAGHPLIGTGLALTQDGTRTIRLPSRQVAFAAEDGQGRFDAPGSLTRKAAPSRDAVAACVMLPPDVLLSAPVHASWGVPYVLAEVAPEVLDTAGIDATAHHAAATGPGGGEHFSIYLWARAGDGARARMFAPEGGIPEDPATGSAACVLAAHLAETEGRTSLAIRQGEAMGRPSLIDSETTLEDGRATSLRIMGRAVRTDSGVLER